MAVLTPTRSTEDAPIVSPVSPSVSDTPAVSTHRKARASALATVSLLLGVPALLAVASGTLAAAGAALGLIAMLFAVGGLAAAVIGVLAVTGNLPWFDTATDQFSRLTDWLDAHASWLTPEI